MTRAIIFLIPQLVGQMFLWNLKAFWPKAKYTIALLCYHTPGFSHCFSQLCNLMCF
jgi:hypothetical protein